MPGPSDVLPPDGPLREGPSHYELLRVAPDASREQLRQAFRALSKRYHPDTTDLPAAEAELVFRQLRQAYAVLNDPIARSRYDGELRRRAEIPAPAVSSGVMAPSPRSQPRGAEVRRALSGGEWLALLLLALALAFSLVLGVGLALARGTELVHWPSWWASSSADPGDTGPAGAAARPQDPLPPG